MFRYTTTLLVIFLVLNQNNLATARTLKLEDELRKEEKRDVSESESSLVPHSRNKRSWATAFSVLATGAFAASVGVTIYTEITKCKHTDPDMDCKTPSCNYYPCPDICVDVEANDKYLREKKDVFQEKLTEMDKLTTAAETLALDAASASLSNEAIFNKINEILEVYDRTMIEMAKLDRNISAKFAMQSDEIQEEIRNYQLTLEEILASPPVDSIFDKWTWEGTGLFTLSIALPIGIKGVKILRQRWAINKIYSEMKVDFLNRITANSKGSVNRAMTRDYWVKQLENPKVKAQLKLSAKTTYNAQQAQQQPSKWSGRMNNALNLAVAAISIYSTWKVIDQCKELANDLHKNAYKLANQLNDLEEIKVTELDPLWESVNNEAWGGVKELLTNETTTDSLDAIRNLTLGAANANTTTADTIQDFIDNIGAADVSTTQSMQSKLIEALSSVKYKYSCLSDKLHAITIVLEDCEDGRDTFEQLYQDVAVIKNELNREDCVSDDEVPYTSIEQFRTIVEAWADHQGWYSNCLLNSESLLYQVCTEYLKGYRTADLILNQLNVTDLTSDMVDNFLERCPDPEITPKAIEDTCLWYCTYQTVTFIAETVQLKESQVESIITTCPICDTSDSQVEDICTEWYCKLTSIEDIEAEIQLPRPTLEFVIANNCSGKCIIDDATLQNKICEPSICEGVSTSEIAEDEGYPESVITGLIADCNTVCPTVDPIIAANIKTYYCLLGWSAQDMIDRNAVQLPVETIQSIIDDIVC